MRACLDLGIVVHIINPVSLTFFGAPLEKMDQSRVVSRLPRVFLSAYYGSTRVLRSRRDSCIALFGGCYPKPRLYLLCLTRAIGARSNNGFVQPGWCSSRNGDSIIVFVSGRSSCFTIARWRFHHYRIDQSDCFVHRRTSIVMSRSVLLLLSSARVSINVNGAVSGHISISASGAVRTCVSIVQFRCSRLQCFALSEGYSACYWLAFNRCSEINDVASRSKDMAPVSMIGLSLDCVVRSRLRGLFVCLLLC